MHPSKYKTTDHMIDILDALRAGDPVQRQEVCAKKDEWEFISAINPNFVDYIYRRAPVTVEAWANVHATGIVLYTTKEFAQEQSGAAKWLRTMVYLGEPSVRSPEEVKAAPATHSAMRPYP